MTRLSRRFSQRPSLSMDGAEHRQQPVEEGPFFRDIIKTGGCEKLCEGLNGCMAKTVWKEVQSARRKSNRAKSVITAAVPRLRGLRNPKSFRNSSPRSNPLGNRSGAACRDQIDLRSDQRLRPV